MAWIKRRSPIKTATKRWEITPDERLLFNGRDYTPDYGMTYTQLSGIVKRLNSLILQSGFPIQIISMNIEYPVAAGLFQTGVITRGILEAGHIEGSALVLTVFVNGEPLRVRVVSATYYEGYDFGVTGHPSGPDYWTVRDMDDALSALGNEGHF